MKTQGGSCQLTSRWEFCLACLYDHTQKCENTHTQVPYMCICSESCFMPQNYCCISPHLYITLFSTSSLCNPPFPTDLQDPSWSCISQTPHQHLIFQTCSSTGFSRLASPSGNPALGSAQPAPSTDPVCSATAPSSPSPPERRGCFPANALPALDYLLFTRIPVEPAPACSDPP